MTAAQKDFEELKAKYYKMRELIARQKKAYEFREFIFACTTPTEDTMENDKRLACRVVHSGKRYGIDDIEPELADELLPAIERFYEKLEKEFEEE